MGRKRERKCQEASAGQALHADSVEKAHNCNGASVGDNRWVRDLGRDANTGKCEDLTPVGRSTNARIENDTPILQNARGEALKFRLGPAVCSLGSFAPRILNAGLEVLDIHERVDNDLPLFGEVREVLEVGRDIGGGPRRPPIRFPISEKHGVERLGIIRPPFNFHMQRGGGVRIARGRIEGRRRAYTNGGHGAERGITQINNITGVNIARGTRVCGWSLGSGSASIEYKLRGLTRTLNRGIT